MILSGAKKRKTRKKVEWTETQRLHQVQFLDYSKEYLTQSVTKCQKVNIKLQILFTMSLFMTGTEKQV